MRTRLALFPLAVAVALSAACGDDTQSDDTDILFDAETDVDAGDTGDEPDAHPPDATDVADASDADAADTPPDVVPDIDAAEVEVDVVEDTANPPTEPLACQGGPVTDEITSEAGRDFELDVENTTTTGLVVRFLGREVDMATDITVSCAADIVPEGYIAVSPAFSVQSSMRPRFGRRYFVQVPFEPSKMPAGAGPASLRVFLDSGDGAFEPVVTNFQEDVRNGNARFETELTGTFQIGIAEDAGTAVDRLWTFRAIGGVSMGGLGSSMVGSRHPEMWDFVAPLGGPAEWVYLAQYIRNGGMGGFGTAPDFGDADPYEPTQEFEHGMSLDNWYFPTGEGTGGSFNRSDYSEIFLDLMMAAGNIVTYNPDSPFRATGLPLEEVIRSASERCTRGNTCPPEEGTVFTIESGFYDNEYNPDGSLPVIAFCDGQGSRNRELEFDRACDVNFDGEPDENNEGLYDNPCDQYRPMDITLAVDVNGNGMRDPGEPVIRNFWEPYQDVGIDGIPSEEEEGYDPVTNPDPAGDDYDYVSNTFGTEGNWLWEEGEPYEDVGIDGLPDTPQVDEDGYDFGEGNERFDYNPNLANIFETLSPRHLLMDMDDEVRTYTNWFIDSGIRDLFNFVVGANQLAGTIQGLGGNLRVYEEFWRVQDLPEGSTDNNFNFTRVDYANLGENVMIRYGDIDADWEDICFGDGKHVGTVLQVANRLLTMLGYITNSFPDGDRTVLRPPYPLNAGTFFAPIGDDGLLYRYSVALPPGYETTQCLDGRDNDGDGWEDGDDPDCTSAGVLSEAGESISVCTDGLDNDVDGRRDEDDPDCLEGDGTSEWPTGSPLRDGRFPVVYIMHGYGMAPEDLQVTALPFSGFMASGQWPKVISIFPDGYCGENELRQCNDNIDNDEDGLVDTDDPDCENDRGRSESGETPRYCNDGVDNDRDGLVDLADGGCRSSDWDTEQDCEQGNFYTNHVSYQDGVPGGPQYEEMLLQLVEHVDEEYRTRTPEVFPYVR